MDICQNPNLSQVQAYRLGYKQGIVAGLVMAAGSVVATKTARMIICDRFGYKRVVKYEKS